MNFKEKVKKYLNEENWYDSISFSSNVENRKKIEKIMSKDNTKKFETKETKSKINNHVIAKLIGPSELKRIAKNVSWTYGMSHVLWWNPFNGVKLIFKYAPEYYKDAPIINDEVFVIKNEKAKKPKKPFGDIMQDLFNPEPYKLSEIKSMLKSLGVVL